MPDTNSVMTLEQFRDELFNIAAFLVGEGDAAEIAARKLRALAQAEIEVRFSYFTNPEA